MKSTAYNTNLIKRSSSRPIYKSKKNNGFESLSQSSCFSYSPDLYQPRKSIELSHPIVLPVPVSKNAKSLTNYDQSSTNKYKRGQNHYSSKTRGKQQRDGFYSHKSFQEGLEIPASLRYSFNLRDKRSSELPPTAITKMASGTGSHSNLSEINKSLPHAPAVDASVTSTSRNNRKIGPMTDFKSESVKADANQKPVTTTREITPTASKGGLTAQMPTPLPLDVNDRRTDNGVNHASYLQNSIPSENQFPNTHSPIEYSPSAMAYNGVSMTKPQMLPSNHNSVGNLVMNEGDQTSSAAAMAQKLSGNAMCEPSDELMHAIESVDQMWRADCSVDCTTLEQTPVEVVVGKNLNEFHVGRILNVQRSENESDGPNNGFGWIVVDFDEWGSMSVPSIRCRVATQAYPHSFAFEEPKETKTATLSVEDEELVTPIRTSKNTDAPDSPDSPDTQHPSPGQLSISPPQWTPVWSGERKTVISVHRAGDMVDLFIPGKDGQPPKWVRSKVVSTICEDPRIVKTHKIPITIPGTNLPHNDDNDAWHCARLWGGYCQCQLVNAQMPCLGLKGGIINTDLYPFFYVVQWPNGDESMTSTVPWQFVRSPNMNGGLVQTDIVEVEFALPPFLTSVSMSAAALNTLTDETKGLDTVEMITEDQIWIQSAHSKHLLNQIRHYSNILHYRIHKDKNFNYKVIFTGTTSQTLTANNYINGEVKHIKSSIEFYERREKRLKLLEERKSRYESNEQLEFEADDSLVGLIIGKQGEHLSKVARTHKVEIRVLPDDEGFRRVRIYGGSLANAQKAKNELVYSFKYLELSQSAHKQLSDRRHSLLKDIAQKYHLNSIWIDVGIEDDKSGVRDATVVAAAQQAAIHPVKCRDIIRGTISNPVLVMCGIEAAVNSITATIRKFSSSKIDDAENSSLASMLGITGGSNNSWNYKNNNQSNDQPWAATNNKGNSNRFNNNSRYGTYQKSNTNRPNISNRGSK